MAVASVAQCTLSVTQWLTDGSWLTDRRTAVCLSHQSVSQTESVSQQSAVSQSDSQSVCVSVSQFWERNPGESLKGVWAISFCAALTDWTEPNKNQLHKLTTQFVQCSSMNEHFLSAFWLLNPLKRHFSFAWISNKWKVFANCISDGFLQARNWGLRENIDGSYRKRPNSTKSRPSSRVEEKIAWHP